MISRSILSKTVHAQKCFFYISFNEWMTSDRTKTCPIYAGHHSVIQCKVGSTDSSIKGIRKWTTQSPLCHGKERNKTLWLVHFLIASCVMHYARICTPRFTLPAMRKPRSFSCWTEYSNVFVSRVLAEEEKECALAFFFAFF